MLTPVAADDDVELEPEPLVAPEVKLGKNCCRSDCNDAYACCADERFPDWRSEPSDVKSCWSVEIGELELESLPPA
jgi:hypothetical protein